MKTSKEVSDMHELQQKVDALQQKVNALAAENSALKDAFHPETVPDDVLDNFGDAVKMDADSFWEGDNCTSFSWVSNAEELIKLALNSAGRVETPATDAAIRELQAQGVEIAINKLKALDTDGFAVHSLECKLNELRNEGGGGGCVMDKIELKPCPFCGSNQVEAFAQYEDDCPDRSAIVRCFNCDAQTAQMVGRDKLVMAARAWNKRVGGDHA